MVKRGSELASICGYQGIVSVQKRKFMHASIGIRKYPTRAGRSQHAASTMAPDGSANVFEAFYHLRGSCGLQLSLFESQAIAAYSTC